MELETHLQIGFRLKYLNVEQLDNLLAQSGEIGRMLNGLKASLQRKLNPQNREPKSLPLP